MKDAIFKAGGFAVLWFCARTWLDRLVTGLEKLGIETETKGHRPETVLQEALLATLPKGTSKEKPLVSPLAGRKHGWHVGTVQRGDKRNHFTHQASIAIDETDTLIILDGWLPQATLKALGAKIDELKGIVDASLVSQLLVRIVEELGGVNINPGQGRGAVYWLPDGKREQWEAVKRVVIDASYNVPTEITTLSIKYDDELCTAVNRAIVADISKSVRDIAREVDKGTMKKRALDGKVGTCATLRERVRQYEEILGESLDSLHNSVTEVQGVAVRASVQAAGQARASGGEASADVDGLFDLG